MVLNNVSNKIYIMTTSLPLTYGGRTSSLLQRSRLLTNYNKKVDKAILVTTNYNPDYEDIYQDYRKKNTVNKKTSFENMYEWFKWSNKVGEKENYKGFLNNTFGNELFGFKKNETSHLTFFYKNGIPLYSLSYNRNKDRIGHINIYGEEHKYAIKRMYLNNNLNIHKIRYFKNKEEEIVRDVFVDQEMNAYLTKEYSYHDGKILTDRFILFPAHAGAKVFNSKNELIRYWFEKIFKNEDIIINEVRALDKPLIGVNKKLKRIFQLHGPHLYDPSNLDSETKKTFRTLFEDANDNDTIISLTNGQKEDIIQKYPRLKNNIIVIPHCIEHKVDIKHRVQEKNICIVSRLVDSKRIDHSIKAFSQFLNEKTDWVLNIYGVGEKEKSLKELVSKLGIENSVNFKGYTDNPREVFQTSEFSLMTSLFEGFGMTVMESVVNGCPVVSYDLNWGPGEIIDKNSGMLVKNGDITKFKDAMIEIAENPPKRKNVINSSKKFRKKLYLREWAKII